MLEGRGTGETYGAAASAGRGAATAGEGCRGFFDLRHMRSQKQRALPQAVHIDILHECRVTYHTVLNNKQSSPWGESFGRHKWAEHVLHAVLPLLASLDGAGQSREPHAVL